MSDFLSLSVLQLLSVFSFLTSVLAVVCVGSGSLHKLAHRLDPAVDAPSDISIPPGKHPLWNWNAIPAAFSIGSLIGEDDQDDHPAYVGGSDLSRMDWHVGRPRMPPTATQAFDSRAPMSMAKLIMLRHTQRRPTRLSRRMPGMPRPSTPRSRLAESSV